MKKILSGVLALASIAVTIWIGLTRFSNSDFFRGISSEMIRYQGVNLRLLLLVPGVIFASYLFGYVFARSNR